MLDILIFFIVCFVGSVIQGVSGFGFAIFTMAILPFLIPFKIASITGTLLAVVMTSQLAFRLRKHINVQILIFPLIASIAGRTFGVYALVNFEVAILKKTLGVILILLSIWLIYFNHKVKIKAGKGAGMVAGLTSGVLGGMCNVGGPPLVIYFFSALEDKMVYNATIQAIFAMSGVYTAVLHFYYGNVSIDVLKLAGTGFVAVVAGSSMGLRILDKINKELLGKIIYVFICVMGIVMLFSGSK